MSSPPAPAAAAAGAGAGAATGAPANTSTSTSTSTSAADSQPHARKRKRFEKVIHRHGSKAGAGAGGARGARGGGRERGGQRRDLGRGEWSRTRKDRRAANEAENLNANGKRAKLADGGVGPDGDEEGEKALNGGRDYWLGHRASTLPKVFSEEEIAAEERKPKHKVAVMLGYCGSGYRGMQISPTEKTIEGDIFAAFVAAGAISKANANDPKKSSLVRCARTDKGVHAAGNVISLKLIVEDQNIVQKINEHLPPQIRIWGFARTTGSFSCYQACDSRWYEYLIPSHAFLPPHPNSWLGKKLDELAVIAKDWERYQARQSEVVEFWNKVEEQTIRPIMDALDPSIAAAVEKALKGTDWDDEADMGKKDEMDNLDLNVPSATSAEQESQDVSRLAETHETDPTTHPDSEDTPVPGGHKYTPDEIAAKRRLDIAIKALKVAYIQAKRDYRITADRMERISAALQQFIGTKNFHNYTVQKTFRDPSAKRIIKSFVLDPEPKTINGTEWLSLKIHGQSFMMHQIRKMVGMVALVVRCGCPVSRIGETLQDVSLSVPKAPGLGLLLERPVFQSYNEGAATKFGRTKLGFEEYETEMNEFKQREIYDRIHREEESGNHFHVFFSHVDQFKEADFLYLSSMGVEAAKPATKTSKEPSSARKRRAEWESDDEDGKNDGQDG